MVDAFVVGVVVCVLRFDVFDDVVVVVCVLLLVCLKRLSFC